MHPWALAPEPRAGRCVLLTLQNQLPGQRGSGGTEGYRLSQAAGEPSAEPGCRARGDPQPITLNSRLLPNTRV